jgi:DNA-binding IclR family transcriptional regulator
MISSRAVSTAARNGVQVVQRVAAILAALRGEPDGLSLAQIADRVGLARSTVHRLVAALEQERFVVAASSSRGFRLGPALAGLASAAARDMTLVIRPYLVDLSEKLNETVDLAVLEHDHVLFVDQVAAPAQRLRAVSAVGAVFPAHCTANGKALLARLSAEELTRLLPAKLQRLTPHTIVSRSALLEELDQVRREGVAFDREEHTVGICAVGAVIAITHGLVAAVTVPLPAQRFYGNEGLLVAEVLGTRDAILGELEPA